MEELRFAIRCHGSTKKPALRRQCSKCLHHPADSCVVDSPNGIILKELRKSPVPPPNNETQFRYNIDDTYSDYRDSSQT